ncbi:hypothetical protein DY000_02045440 [Brassica cretica]|uniref:RNase H type-1 domain-containing protein n=1 Tax=Brassica cretica TaxID=69181 RepID=A0ABQ7F2M4_BRACR|nr:hypothetical protein DY000_02045440 [Brassica cretica]
MRWIPPKKDWLMCNVGFDWVKQTKLLGVVWVVRNHRGVVIIHSRRAFSNIESLDDVRVVSVLWTVESMTSLHYNKVVFVAYRRKKTEERQSLLKVSQEKEGFNHMWPMAISLGFLNSLSMKAVSSKVSS